MKYKQTSKKMSRMSIWEAIEDKTCRDALRYYKKFDAEFKNSPWTDSMHYEEDGYYVRVKEFLEKNHHLYPWFVRHGFLEEVKEKKYDFEVYTWENGDIEIRYKRYILLHISSKGVFSRVGGLPGELDGLEIVNERIKIEDES